MLILCGKTASGKDTIQKELIKKGMTSIVSYTTRPMRDGEIDGINYHYVSEEEFIQKKNSGFFAETTSYSVASGEVWYYGSAVEDLTNEKVFITNPDGLREIVKMEGLNPVVFYISASEETIWNRLRQRGDNSEEARRRLNADDEDFKDIEKYYDFAIKNDGSMSPELMSYIILKLYRHTMQKQMEVYCGKKN